MKITIILIAVMVVALAVYNLILAAENRSTKAGLDGYRYELDRREIELNLREGAVENALEEIKAQNLNSQDARPIKASYVVTESDEYRYSTEKLMENGIRKHLAATIADSLIREFGSPDGGTTPEGRKIYTYSFMAKRV